MKALIAKFDMAVLFNTETPLLKLDFYILDRLISIFLPDLHHHFKVSAPINQQEENVNSSFFSTSFFITLFTQVLQSQSNADNMWKLQRIWDYIVIVRSGDNVSTAGKRCLRCRS